jgi:hypothetical protein
MVEFRGEWLTAPATTIKTADDGGGRCPQAINVNMNAIGVISLNGDPVVHRSNTLASQDAPTEEETRTMSRHRAGRRRLQSSLPRATLQRVRSASRQNCIGSREPVLQELAQTIFRPAYARYSLRCPFPISQAASVDSLLASFPRDRDRRDTNLRGNTRVRTIPASQRISAA